MKFFKIIQNAVSYEFERLESSWAKREAEWAKREAEWAKREAELNRQILSLKGVLLSRGIFERFLRIIQTENPTQLQGKFNAAEVCGKLGSLKQGSLLHLT